MVSSQHNIQLRPDILLLGPHSPRRALHKPQRRLVRQRLPKHRDGRGHLRAADPGAETAAPAPTPKMGTDGRFRSGRVVSYQSLLPPEITPEITPALTSPPKSKQDKKKTKLTRTINQKRLPDLHPPPPRPLRPLREQRCDLRQRARGLLVLAGGEHRRDLRLPAHPPESDFAAHAPRLQLYWCRAQQEPDCWSGHRVRIQAVSWS